VSEPTADRRAAYEVLRRTFDDGAFTDRAFTVAAARLGLTGRELARARRLAYGSVQRRGTADHLISVLSRRRRKLDSFALAALRLGLFELLYSKRPDEHAAVDQAVGLARAGARRDRVPRGRAEAGTGFVNALLRRAAGEREQLLAGLDDSSPDAAALAHSYPQWMARMWWEELGPEEARLLMAAMNEPRETALRVNTLRAQAPALAAELREDGVEVSGPGSGSLLDPSACLVVGEATDAVGARIATGELVPQSRGSQAVLGVLDPRPGERVLDLCAGPGIKTTGIAARIGDRGEIVSVESDPRRAEELRELCARAGVRSVRVTVGDAAEADLGSGYDRILLDPPCSDLGTLASRPDARWRKSPDTVARLAALQRRLLVRAARALAPAGSLVYSTCTISARENERVVAEATGYAEVELDDLGATHPRLRSRRDPRCLQLLPQRDRTTGFFIARIRRAAG